jgi:hypothetical protein
MGVHGGLVGGTTASSMVGGIARWRLQRSSSWQGGDWFAPPAPLVVEGVGVFPSKVQCLFRIIDDKVRLVVAYVSVGWLFLSIRRKPYPIFHAGAGNGDTLRCRLLRWRRCYGTHGLPLEVLRAKAQSYVWMGDDGVSIPISSWRHRLGGFHHVPHVGSWCGCFRRRCVGSCVVLKSSWCSVELLGRDF